MPLPREILDTLKTDFANCVITLGKKNAEYNIAKMPGEPALSNEVEDALHDYCLHFKRTYNVRSGSTFTNEGVWTLEILHPTTKVFMLRFRRLTAPAQCDECGHSRAYWESFDMPPDDVCWKCVMCSFCGHGPASTGAWCDNSAICQDQRSRV